MFRSSICNRKKPLYSLKVRKKNFFIFFWNLKMWIHPMHDFLITHTTSVYYVLKMKKKKCWILGRTGVEFTRVTIKTKPSVAIILRAIYSSHAPVEKRAYNPALSLSLARSFLPLAPLFTTRCRWHLNFFKNVFFSPFFFRLQILSLCSS